MKIHSITRCLAQSKSRLVASCVAMTIVVATCNTADAQSGGLLKFLSQSPSSSLKTTASSPNRSINNGGQNYRVVNAAAIDVPTAANSSRRTGSRAAVQTAGVRQGTIGSAIQNGNALEQVAFLSDCTLCGRLCGGSCRGSYSAPSMDRFAPSMNSCIPCDPYRFLSVEALYMERDGEDRYSLNHYYGMDGFDLEWGYRITAGSVPDCVHGYEFTITGPIEWDMGYALGNSAGGINTALIPGNPVSAASLSTFNNAVTQSTTYFAEYWSLEANKTLIGWDAAKLLVGLRYIDYDEDFFYQSLQGTGEAGLLRSSTANQMFGGQVGMDLLYPVGRFAYADFRGRAGMFLNFADSDVQLFNDGAAILANSDDDEEIAGFFEIGSGLRYHLGQALTIRGGAELWYLTGAATAPEQIQTIVRPSMGSQIQMDDDIFFYGVTFGAEIRI
ncbi:MAG: hypothetical protein HKN47_28610 [Pirellulaceae bacterium]|nr:hypothetical protein [Pirellulaceae bacterium]